MQFDALVCLSSSSGRTIFFSVCDLNPTPPNTEKALGKVSANAGPSPAELAYTRRQADIPSLHADAECAALALTMIDFKAEDVRWMTSQMGKSFQSHNTLVEFPGVLLPSFKPTLEALQEMSGSLDLPFRDIIAPKGGQTETTTMEPPSYAQERGFAYDLSPITGGEPLRFGPGQPFDLRKLE